MPTLDNHASSLYTKILYIGDSSSGKTGSLVSLLKDGYSMRVLDMDNGLTAMKQFGRAAGADLSRVEYETYRDEYRMTAGGPMVKGQRKPSPIRDGQAH
jgi:GTPase SAR1 family protein